MADDAFVLEIPEMVGIALSRSNASIVGPAQQMAANRGQAPGALYRRGTGGRTSLRTVPLELAVLVA